MCPNQSHYLLDSNKLASHEQSAFQQSRPAVTHQLVYFAGTQGNALVGGLLVHQIRDVSASGGRNCRGRFASFVVSCTLTGTLYTTTADGATVAVSASESQAALTGDTQSSVVGPGLPAFGVDPVFLLGSPYYDPSMQSQIGDH